MPESPHDAGNEHGATSDYWEGFKGAYWQQREDLAFLRDAMHSSTGQGSGFEHDSVPAGMRFMSDAYAAGMVIASELFEF